LDVIAAPPDERVIKADFLLCCVMGSIIEAPAQQFTIHPDGHAREIMGGIEHSPFVSLEAALAAIEKHTRSVCRHHPGEDHP
jgi:hypothetical protein